MDCHNIKAEMTFFLGSALKTLADSTRTKEEERMLNPILKPRSPLPRSHTATSVFFFVVVEITIPLTLPSKVFLLSLLYLCTHHWHLD